MVITAVTDAAILVRVDFTMFFFSFLRRVSAPDLN